MKKIFFLLAGVFLLTGFSACNDDNDVVPRNPNTAFIVTLDPQNWERISNAKIVYDIPLSDLTDYYMDQGGVAVALSFDGEDSYDVLPTVQEGISYNINYTTGWITIYAEDPLADDNVDIDFPTGTIIAKIILTETDYLDYQGLFKANSGIDFKPLK